MQVEDDLAEVGLDVPSTARWGVVPASLDLNGGLRLPQQNDIVVAIRRDTTQYHRAQPAPEQVEIVDGEVAEDTTVAMRGCPSGAENIEVPQIAEASDLLEEDMPGRIATLDHAAGQDSPASAKRVVQGLGLGEGWAERFLDQHVKTVSETAQGVGSVEVVRGADDGAFGLGHLEENVEGCRARDAVPVGQGEVAVGIALHDADQAEASSSLDGTQVVGSHPSGPDKDRPRA